MGSEKEGLGGEEKQGGEEQEQHRQEGEQGLPDLRGEEQQLQQQGEEEQGQAHEGPGLQEGELEQDSGSVYRELLDNIEQRVEALRKAALQLVEERDQLLDCLKEVGNTVQFINCSVQSNKV